jgi:hypothetical protein
LVKNIAIEIAAEVAIETDFVTYVGIKLWIVSVCFRPETLKCSQIEDLVPIKLCPGAQGSQKFQGSFIVPSNLKLPSIIRRIGSVSIETI